MCTPGSAERLPEVDAEAVAGAARACRGVEALLGGFPEVATYLPGRRVLGVRVTPRAVEIQLRAAWGIPADEVAAGVQAAVAPLVPGRAVDVTIGDLGDPPEAGPPTGAPTSATTGAAGLLDARVVLAHASAEPAKTHGDLLGSEAMPHRANAAA
ncbi:hypothetical protein Cs7R123_05190 [Catellatospora sp. TT07R-123]|uniref:hypothetical protein n=1 Tax=Catellatospora sp. TT07R-123 TaxID=2733863 RepID=UPI001B0A56EC|nr:hypothetical protein [Catellatospora sp. TT07R-123]GHJ43177.1 hypothetical protein Cs7R123_05190 [Catellatospora sp. TT07R-123]